MHCKIIIEIHHEISIEIIPHEMNVEFTIQIHCRIIVEFMAEIKHKIIIGLELSVHNFVIIAYGQILWLSMDNFSWSYVEKFQVMLNKFVHCRRCENQRHNFVLQLPFLHKAVTLLLFAQCFGGMRSSISIIAKVWTCKEVWKLYHEIGNNRVYKCFLCNVARNIYQSHISWQKWLCTNDA